MTEQTKRTHTEAIEAVARALAKESFEHRADWDGSDASSNAFAEEGWKAFTPEAHAAIAALPAIATTKVEIANIGQRSADYLNGFEAGLRALIAAWEVRISHNVIPAYDAGSRQ